MAKPIWQQKLQEKLEQKPMCFVGKTSTVKHVACLKPGEVKGQRVSVRHIANYNCFNTCEGCGQTVR